MATKPEKVTNRTLLTPKQVKDILHVGYNRASRIVNQLNEELAAKGFLVIEHKIPESYLYQRFGVGVKI